MEAGGDQKFKVILDHIGSFRPASDAWDLVWKERKAGEEEREGGKEEGREKKKNFKRET